MCKYTTRVLTGGGMGVYVENPVYGIEILSTAILYRFPARQPQRHHAMNVGDGDCQTRTLSIARSCLKTSFGASIQRIKSISIYYLTNVCNKLHFSVLRRSVARALCMYSCVLVMCTALVRPANGNEHPRFLHLQQKLHRTWT